MELKRLSLSSFRNTEDGVIEFEPGINLLYGENAQGKTNLLESIYFFARGKSFRGAGDSEMLGFSKDSYSISISFHASGRDQTLLYRFADGKRRREKNGVILQSQAEMLGHFRCVIFYPEHLQLVKGGPAERREFLNVAISQCYPEYLSLYAAYKKYLENRNSLLRFAQKGLFFDSDELSVFSKGLAEYAAEIHLYRRRYLALLQKEAAFFMKEISGGREELSLSYLSDVNGQTKEELILAYMRLFSEQLNREIAAGCTLFGVHREDILILINGISAKDFGSQGQQRSTVLSLKLAEGEVSYAVTGEHPVFLLDDVLSELDSTRRDYILHRAGEGKQIIITSCEAESFQESDRVNLKIKVEKGYYVPSYRKR
ncbi:MAG: DNA replication/repair protein RecF [Clostridia bacterium]|nr:DNA replication/repair protein RecF [Clostridia bacterium]